MKIELRMVYFLFRFIFTSSFAIFVGVSAIAQRPLGVDVANYQSNNVNWASVKAAGYVFAWAKATEGVTFNDADFTINQANARNAGVLIGAYHFAHPESDTPSAEANHFWSVAGNYIKADGQSLMPALDYEEFPGAVVGASSYADWANQWCTDVVALAASEGVVIRPVIYISADNTPYLGTENNWTIPWIANYNGQNPQTSNPWYSSSPNEIWGAGAWDLWQYSSSVTVPGVTTGPCDVDVFNGTTNEFVSTFLIGTIELSSEPASVTVPLGGTATFGATAGGENTLGYQWQFNHVNIPGATSNSYAVSNVQLTSAGGYSVLVTNSVGSVSSSTAFLSVLGPLTNAPNSALDPSGMVNWWTADGNPFDIYGATNAVPNGGLSYTNGKVGLAFRFDGSSAYLTDSGGELAPPWTVSAWVYRQNSSQVSATLLGDGTFAVKLQQYGHTSDVGLSHSLVADYYFNTGLPVNAWSHIAIAYSGSQIQLYINGALATSQLYSNAVAISTPAGLDLPRANIGVDKFAGSPDDYMLGAVDELQIYSRALNASEINSIYAAGSAGLVRAPEFTGVTNLADGQVEFSLRGQTGKPIGIESTTNLATGWTSFGSISNSLGATNYIDSTASPLKFYRATQKY